jgi:hypothetical protein
VILSIYCKIPREFCFFFCYYAIPVESYSSLIRFHGNKFS